MRNDDETDIDQEQEGSKEVNIALWMKKKMMLSIDTIRPTYERPRNLSKYH